MDNPTVSVPTPERTYSTMVLLVDDQPLVGEMVRRLLSAEEDIQLHYCSEARRAIDVANQIKPTVILQDLVMPDVQGLELVRRFRANSATAETPVIVLSSKEDPQVKGDAFAAGANDYLVKLPDPIEMMARIRYHSRAYLNQVQRDEAYRALRVSQQQLLEKNTALMELNVQLEEANCLVSEMARRDSLTGLMNRRVLDEQTIQEASRAQRKASPLTVILIDLDRFKSINDNFGHATGDEVLRAFGAFLNGEVRPFDLAARYGGEEFVVLAVEADLEEGIKVAERIQHNLTRLTVPGYPHSITASMGVATLSPGQPIENLIPRADTALYRAKENGRNRVEWEDRPAHAAPLAPD